MTADEKIAETQTYVRPAADFHPFRVAREGHGALRRMAMIESKTGDILTADVEGLVNTVNCVGIMGRGVALQFKNDFPANFKAYKGACARAEVQPGKMFVFETGRLSNPKFIINFPTKRHWRGKSRMEDIDWAEGARRGNPQSRHPLHRDSAPR
jgi:hypothetical protein